MGAWSGQCASPIAEGYRVNLRSLDFNLLVVFDGVQPDGTPVPVTKVTVQLTPGPSGWEPQLTD